MMLMGYPPSSTTSVSNPTQPNPIKSGEALYQAKQKVKDLNLYLYKC